MNRQHSMTVLAALAVSTLAACSGSSSSSGGVTEQHAAVSRGAITAKSPGSMTVNGIQFSTAGATIRMDGQAGLDEWLQKGMVVTVRGGMDDRNGNATEIEFEHGVEGRVDEVGEDWIVVGGQRVHVDDSTEFGEDNPDRLGSIAVGDVVAVSGVPDDRGGLRASRVDDSTRSPDSFDVKGFVAALDATAKTFELRLSPEAAASFEVDYSGLATVPAGLADGAYVEVHTGSALGAGTPPVLVASAIEIEDRFGATEVEVEGIVTSIPVTGATPSFVVDGVTVVTDASTRWTLGDASDLTLGVKLEAEGSLDQDGVLHAHKVSYRPGARITGTVTDLAADRSSMKVLGVTVQIPSYVRNDFSSLQDGQKVEVRGNPAANGNGLVALRVRPPTGNADRVFIRGVVAEKANANPSQPTFKVLGFDVTTAGAEFRGLSDEPLGAQAFYAAVETGRTVIKVRADSETLAIGGPAWIADELELEGDD
jgi:hypothetical protein